MQPKELEWRYLAVVFLSGVASWSATCTGRSPRDSNLPEVSAAVKAAATCEPRAEGFFPAGLLTLNADVDRHARLDYARFLMAMGEAPLSCGDAPKEVYRLLRLERNGAPLAVRVSDSGATKSITSIELQAPMWKGPGLIIRQAAGPLPAEQWKVVSAAVRASGFWAMSSFERWDGDDGSPWLLEGRRGTGYHVVDRASPQKGPFRELCDVLIKLSNNH
jgi:hypothetical protein